jgi:large subunit ribosomal protein L15
MLERLSPRPGARHRTKRVGRGPGSGHGKTSTRGVKGQGKRNETVHRHSEGGQNPLVRRIPKHGFRPRSHVVAEVVNVGDLAGFAEGARVDATALRARGLIRGRGAPVKLLANGEAPRGLVVCVDRASAAARAKVEAAGGKVEIAS